MIRNILFDMGGVIFDQNTEEAFRRFKTAGLDTDYYMGAHGQRGFFLDLESGAITAEEFCHKMSEVVGREVSYDEAERCWLGFFNGVKEEKLRCLEALRKNYHLCLLSNTNPFVMGFTRSSKFSEEGRPITDFFDSMFCSYEMKCCKPDMEIYTKALHLDNMKADECLFIDDSKANTDAASRAGMRVLTVKTNDDWMPALYERLKD